MKVRAVATPRGDSNAIGTVELECTATGLHTAYTSVAAYRAGYAPGAVTSGTHVFATWADVLSVRDLGDAVTVAVNPALTPHHKLCLTSFSDGDAPGPEEYRKRRWLLRVGLVTAFFILVSAVALASRLPAPSGAPSVVFAVGVVAALLIFVAGFFAERLWLHPERDSAQVQRAFLAELRHFRPAPVLSGSPALASPGEPLSWQAVLERIPRSTTAIVITLSSMSLAGILTSNWIIRGPDAPRAAAPSPPPLPKPPKVVTPPEPANPAPATASTGTSQTAATPAGTAPQATAAEEVCRCDRPDSALWRAPFPRMTTLLISQRPRRHKDHHHLELELAVVNNSRDKLPEPSLLVHFFEQDGKKPTKNRPLYYEGTLRPGQAIKWHVEARGTSFSVDNARGASLTDADMASADAFAELLSANHRPVRLHGAMMLAYLGDQRAKAGAIALKEALREEEGPYLHRVLSTLTDVVPCQLRMAESGRFRETQLCVHNKAPVEMDQLGLKLRALDSPVDPRNPVAKPPTIVAEQVFRLPGAWPADTGRWVSLTLDTDNASGVLPRELEAFVDRYELLY